MSSRPLLTLALALALLGCSRDAPTPGPAPTASAPRVEPSSPAHAAPHPSAAHPASPPDPFAARAAAHEKTVSALVAAFNAHDAKAIAALYDPGCVVRGPTPGGFAPETGREPLVVGHEALFASQPDVKSATVRLLLVGDFAIQEWATEGTAAASGKKVGFRAASVYRFGGEGISKDDTYFDLLTPAMQTGKRDGAARPIPALPAKPEVVVAEEGNRDAAGVTAIRNLYGALRTARAAEGVAELLAEDVTQTSMLTVDDTVGRDAVVKEIMDLRKMLPWSEVERAWGNEAIGVAAVVLRRDAKEQVIDAPILHALHVVDLRGGRITRSVIYASRSELEGG